MKKIADGDLTPNIDLKNKNEIGRLADDISKMVRGLRELIIKITHTAEQLATLEEITESAQAFFELADDLEIIISEFKL